MIPLTALCALACAALVAAEYRHHARARAIAKVIASLAFLAIGLAAWGHREHEPVHWHAYQLCLVAGLALGVAGDIALLGKTDRAFLAGLGAFLLGHLAYVIAFAQLEPPRAWLADAGWAAVVPVVVAAGALVMLWRRLGSMRIPVIGYVIAICTMVIAALAIQRAMPDDALPQPVRDRIAIGAVLFFASDLSVARDKFIGATFANKAWGLPAYYAGQLCLAWSLAG